MGKIAVNSLYIAITIILLMVLFPQRSLAIDIVPSLDSIDILTGQVSPQYLTAAKSAQKAFLIQSGINGNFEKFRSHVNDKSTSIETKILDKSLNTIEQFTSIRREYVLFTAGGVYTILVKRFYRQDFASPLCRGATHYIKWSPDSTETGVTFNF